MQPNKTIKLLLQVILLPIFQVQAQFTKIETGSTDNINSITCNDQYCIISDFYELFAKTYDSGENLYSISNPRYSYESKCELIYVDSDKFYLRLKSASPTFSSRILRTSDGGQNWVEIFDTTGAYSGFAMHDDTLGTMVGTFGKILTTESGWDAVHYDTFGNTYFISAIFISPEKVLLGGNNLIIKSNDSGQTWSFVTNTDHLNIKGFSITSDSSVFATADNGNGLEVAIYKSTDQGGNWSKVFDSLGYYINSISFINGLEGYAVGKMISSGKGLLYITYNGGDKWHLVETPWDESLISIDFSNDSTFLVGGTNGLLLRGDRYALRDSLLEDTTDTNDTTVSVPPIIHEKAVRIFPNPAEDELNVSLHLSSNSVVTIDLYSVDLKRVKCLFEGTMARGENTIKCQLEGMESGIYFCEISTASGRKVEKLMIQ